MIAQANYPINVIDQVLILKINGGLKVGWTAEWKSICA